MAETLDRDETVSDFKDAVNMAASELEKWLESKHSKEVGWKGEDGHGESVGHASGRRIIKLLHTNRDELTEDDLAHMRKVVGYVHRHKAQRPGGDVESSRWRYSLMNWGHDPMKKGASK
jgi:hypothetical protein